MIQKEVDQIISRGPFHSFCSQIFWLVIAEKLAVSRLVEKDDRYQLENAAKFRAVGQNVATYDEFKAIVDGCHLKVCTIKEIQWYI